MTLAERVAQLIMVGVPATGLTDECREFFAEHGFGGAIIFGRNCADLAQVRCLTEGLQDLARSSSAKLPLLIATDQEGGIVARLTEASGAVVMPGAMALGATGDPELARRAATASARLLRSVGINMNLAPVADVNNAHNNPVINVRSFGEDPDQVGAFVAAAVDGCQAAGVLATAKHFPGWEAAGYA
jgi:beta-N-acetylhexosaminidase